MSRNFKQLGKRIYIINYGTDKEYRHLEKLLIENNHNIVPSVNLADSLIHIPALNAFKLIYDFKSIFSGNTYPVLEFLKNHSEEDIFLAYVKKKTNELKIYPFNLDKNIGISEHSLELNGNSIIKPDFNNSFEELLWNSNQLIKQKVVN